MKSDVEFHVVGHLFRVPFHALLDVEKDRGLPIQLLSQLYDPLVKDETRVRANFLTFENNIY